MDIKNAIIEQPNNPRDVLVYVLTCGWMMGNCEDKVWRLYFSDTGLSISKNQEHIVRWMELPNKPDDLPKLSWYNGEHHNTENQ